MFSTTNMLFSKKSFYKISTRVVSTFPLHVYANIIRPYDRQHCNTHFRMFFCGVGNVNDRTVNVNVVWPVRRDIHCNVCGNLWVDSAATYEDIWPRYFGITFILNYRCEDEIGE
jgi:hypothetical protein